MSDELPSGWALLTPPDIAAHEPHSLGIGPFGSDLKVADYRGSGVPLIFVRNVRSQVFDGPETRFISAEKAEELRAHWAMPGDVLVTKMGDPPGDACVYPHSRPVGVITADCIRWRVDPLIADSRFLSYAVGSPRVRSQVLAITKGVAQLKVSLGRFSGVRFPFPPVGEQRRVADALDSLFSRLDDAVASLERVQRNLKRYRAAVLQAAVEGRLVPTEAELARAKGRSFEPASELLTRILAERRRRWEESELAKLRAKGKDPKNDAWKKKYVEPSVPDTTELPELPAGWCWASVDQLGEVSGGLTKNASRDTGELKRPYLRVANVYADRLALDDVSHIGLQESELERVLLARGDLLVVEGNGSIDQIGRVALWDGSIDGCVHQNHIIKVRFHPTVLSRWGLRWLLASSGRRVIEKAASSTSGLHTLSISKIQSLPVPLPPLAEQGRVEAEWARLMSVEEQNLTTIRLTLSRCRRLRQSILKWAFEGKLVDQNRSDEPASVLLERIRAERDSSAAPVRRTRRHPRTKK